MSYAAHFIMTVSRASGRIVAVGIYSSHSITSMGGEFHVMPSEHASAEAASYAEAEAEVRERLPSLASWYGRPGSPLHEAIQECAATGMPVAVPWPEVAS